MSLHFDCQKNNKILSYFKDEETETQREKLMDKCNKW